MNSLYDLSNDYAWLLSLLYDEDADEQTLIDTLDSIEGAIDDKAENYAKIIKDLEKSAENMGEEITRLRARQQAVKNRAEWLKGNLYSAMKAVGKTKIKGDIFTVSIQKNGGAAPLRVLVEAEAEVVQYISRTQQKELFKIADSETVKRALDTLGYTKTSEIKTSEFEGFKDLLEALLEEKTVEVDAEELEKIGDEIEM